MRGNRLAENRRRDSRVRVRQVADVVAVGRVDRDVATQDSRRRRSRSKNDDVAGRTGPTPEFRRSVPGEEAPGSVSGLPPVSFRAPRT